MGPPEFESAARGRAETCNEIATLEWGNVQEFYNIASEPDEPAEIDVAEY